MLKPNQWVKDLRGIWLLNQKQNRFLLKKLVFQLLFFLLPTQIGYHFWPNWAFIFGIRVDYLAPTIYLTDILIVILFLLDVTDNTKKIRSAFTKKMLLILFIFSFIFLNIFFAQSSLPALYKWLKILEFSFLGYLVAKDPSIKVFSWIFKPILFSIPVYALVGIMQFLHKGAIGGPFYYLGERFFSIATPGIALASLFGREVLRVYSTFSHPNSLAGYMGAIFLVITPLTKIKDFFYKKLIYLDLGLITILIILSFSLSSWVGLFIAGFLYPLFKKKVLISKKIFYSFFWFLLILSLVFVLFSKELSNLSWDTRERIVKRVVLSNASMNMILKSPIIGVGLNNFTVSLQSNLNYPSVSWWLQPVHNIFLLTFSEAGIVGLTLFVILLQKTLDSLIKQSKPLNRFKLSLACALIFIFITGSFDHYWLTLQQNQLLFSVLIGLSFRKVAN